MNIRNNQVTLDMWIGGFHFRQTMRANMRKGFELKIKNKGKNPVVAVAVWPDVPPLGCHGNSYEHS